MSVQQSLRRLIERLSPKQRQYGMLALLLLGGIGLLWLVFALSGGDSAGAGPKTPATGSPKVTNIGVMSPGQQVNPVDQWVGTAGSKLAQYESEREEQSRLNKDRQAFEARTMQRFAELEQRLTASTQAVQTPPTSAMPPVPTAPAAPMPPAGSLPPPPVPSVVGQRPAVPPLLPPGTPPPLSATAVTPLAPPAPTAPVLTRVAVSERAASGSPAATSVTEPTTTTFLPVSFTRGTLLGGLDAPTGG